MTRDERVRVACERLAEGPPGGHAETVDQGIEAALDAALADVGGLDGLDDARRVPNIELAGSHALAESRVVGLRAERDVLRDEAAALVAERDRLRAAARGCLDSRRHLDMAATRMVEAEKRLREALRESEAGT